MLPVRLFKDFLAGQDGPRSTIPDDNISSAQAATQDGVGSGNAPSVRPLQKGQPKHQLVLRMVDRLPFLRKISPGLAGGNTKRSTITRLLPFRWKHPQGPITTRVERSMVWREDMPEFALRHMQLDVTRKLVRISKRYSRLDAPNGVWSVLEMQEYSDIAVEGALERLQSMDRVECGAVLLVGPFPAGTSFSETVRLYQTQQSIPVFNAAALLSESDLRKLRNAAVPHFQNTALFFRPDDPMSIETMLSLWKLKRFVAPDSKLGT